MEKLTEEDLFDGLKCTVYYTNKSGNKLKEYVSKKDLSKILLEMPKTGKLNKNVVTFTEEFGTEESGPTPPKKYILPSDYNQQQKEEYFKFMKTNLLRLKEGKIIKLSQTRKTSLLLFEQGNL